MSKKELMIIDLPHIAYKIVVKIKPNEFVGEYSKSIMLTENTTLNSSTIYLRKKLKPMDSGTVIHEIVHVLQNICMYRSMTFEREREHMAYLMQYIFGRIYNQEFDV